MEIRPYTNVAPCWGSEHLEGKELLIHLLEVKAYREIWEAQHILPLNWDNKRRAEGDIHRRLSSLGTQPAVGNGPGVGAVALMSGSSHF